MRRSGILAVAALTSIASVAALVTPLGTADAATHRHAAAKPAITAVSPHRAHRGERIIVTGRHLNMATAVLVHGKRAKFLVKSRTKLAVVVPKKATTGRITIRAGKLHTTSAHPLTVTPQTTSTGVINSFAPTSGAYGTTVTLSVSGLTAPCDSIVIGAATGPCAYSGQNTISAAIPAGAITGPITINAGPSTSMSTATSTTSFRVTFGVGLSSSTGPPTSSITVYGAGFGANEAVNATINGAQVGGSYTDGAGNVAVSATIPATAQPGNVSVYLTGQRTGTTSGEQYKVNTNWASQGYNAFGDNFNPYENTVGVSNVAGLGQLWTGQTGNTIYGSPAVANGIVYIGSTDDKLYAYNATTGALLFTDTAGGSIDGSPAVANGIVYIGATDEKLYAYNATTGALLFTATTGGAIEGSPAVANGIVYIGSTDDKFYAYNATTGALLFTATTGNFIYGSPAVANGIVYIGSQDDKLYAFNATTGTLIFTDTTGGTIYGSPAIANGTVYIGSADDKLYAYNATTGALLFTATTGGVIEGSPAVANGIVYIGSEDDKLHAYNATTGALLFTATTGNFIYGSPAVANGIVYIGSQDDKLYAYGLNGPATTPGS